MREIKPISVEQRIIEGMDRRLDIPEHPIAKVFRLFLHGLRKRDVVIVESRSVK